MATIPSDKGSSAGDALSRLRDHYANRERENDQRHRNDIESLRATHKSEIESVRAETQKRVVSLQEENSIKLNEKDLLHKKEIEALKALYQKRVASSKDRTE
jgi:hypothetical protein